MDELNSDRPIRDTERRLAIRWKIVQALGALLIALGLFIEWPPVPEANVPDTSSFLITLGVLLGTSGLLVAWRHD